ncbi:uncharacterized protein B0H18DRAFT_1114921 [Fomitopsis serialis]|uniref:uncharacterized protein n=1 Tax=Fomitopsis serialis TaxID=139415 RepID=UPI0020079EDC|nr:uncharacterized protein B0H18DRAFT_1114921 [Neoantrodia serialis]KAH9934176.1 hypothetical protein B0H18DRAFT_1114921 [Neoantrodia serialis]
MSNCDRCRHPQHRFFRCSKDGHSVQGGDIYCTNTSLVAPLEFVLGLQVPFALRDPSSKSIRGSRTSLVRSRKSTSTFGSKMYAANARPCLVLNIEGSAKVTACVMGTLDGRDIRCMPRIYRHFSVPVAPNFGGCCTPEDEHVHTIPEWDGWVGKAQWLIAIPHILPRRMFKALVVSISRRKEDEWNRWSEADPNFLQNARDEYNAHRASYKNGRIGRQVGATEDGLTSAVELDTVLEERHDEGVVEAIIGFEDGVAIKTPVDFSVALNQRHGDASGTTPDHTSSTATCANSEIEDHSSASTLASHSHNSVPAESLQLARQWSPKPLEQRDGFEPCESSKDESGGASLAPMRKTSVEETLFVKASVPEQRKPSDNPLHIIPRSVLTAMRRRTNRAATAGVRPQHPPASEVASDHTVYRAQPSPKRSLSRILPRIPPLRKQSGESTGSGSTSRRFVSAI